jgi:4-deoxy-L-threo-5-hexosulose-uronate ketol-isomerase
LSFPAKVVFLKKHKINKLESMKTELRYAVHPADFKKYDTEKLRKEFLIENIFVPGEISLIYSMYDRYMVGGAMPVNKDLNLETADDLKSVYFLERREMGIINVGGEAEIEAGGITYNIGFKEALYLGKETMNVVFRSVENKRPAKLYINSAPAHHIYPSRKVTIKDAEIVTLGSPEASNHRTIIKLLINSILPTCQLQMGMTELKTGSVWNTMPVHTLNRRLEAYFYLRSPKSRDLPFYRGSDRRGYLDEEGQAVLSPSWSIHSAEHRCSIWEWAKYKFCDMDVRCPIL